MTYPLEIHVTAPEGTAKEVVTAAVRAALPEYENEWGDHSAVSYSVELGQVVPIVYDEHDTPETPKAHIWVVFIPND
jgi:hypothetical protein